MQIVCMQHNPQEAAEDLNYPRIVGRRLGGGERGLQISALKWRVILFQVWHPPIARASNSHTRQQPAATRRLPKTPQCDVLYPTQEALTMSSKKYIAKQFKWRSYTSRYPTRNWCCSKSSTQSCPVSTEIGQLPTSTSSKTSSIPSLQPPDLTVTAGRSTPHVYFVEALNRRTHVSGTCGCGLTL